MVLATEMGVVRWSGLRWGMRTSVLDMLCLGGWSVEQLGEEVQEAVRCVVQGAGESVRLQGYVLRCAIGVSRQVVVGTT